LKRLFACLTLAALLATGVQAQERPEGAGRPDGSGGPPRRRGYANPSGVIAAEFAFARLAQEKGQWTAFLATSAPEAEMFVPQRVLAQAWLKRRPNPPAALKWQPWWVWSSCDGSYAVTRGPWQGARGRTGMFTTVWQRQPKKGDYRWVIDIGSDQTPPAEPETIPALVADCDGPDLPVSPGAPLQAGDDSKTAVSRDGSLRWTSTVHADGSRRFVVTMRSEGKVKDVVDFTAAAGQ
jgi:hypothetical protein